QKRKPLGIKSLLSNQTNGRSHVDNREAKFILNAYRPAGQDASDPRFAEAFEQARRDPGLDRWFSESIAFDTAMTEKLRALEVPPDLRENILAGVKVSRPLRWSKPFIKWAIAAALISLPFSVLCCGAKRGRHIWPDGRTRRSMSFRRSLGTSRVSTRSRSMLTNSWYGCARTMRRPRKHCRTISTNCGVSAARLFHGMECR